MKKWINLKTYNSDQNIIHFKILTLVWQIFNYSPIKFGYGPKSLMKLNLSDLWPSADRNRIRALIVIVPKHYVRSAPWNYDIVIVSNYYVRNAPILLSNYYVIKKVFCVLCVLPIIYLIYLVTKFKYTTMIGNIMFVTYIRKRIWYFGSWLTPVNLLSRINHLLTILIC